MAIAGDIPLSDAHWVLVDILTLILSHAQNQSTRKNPFYIQCSNNSNPNCLHENTS